jgi:uncharacterized surface protein with fasciclin (FAS1) repeats
MQQRGWTRVATRVAIAGLFGWVAFATVDGRSVAAAQSAPLASASSSAASPTSPGDHAAGGAGSGADHAGRAASEPAMGNASTADGGAVPGIKAATGKDMADTLMADERFTTLAQAIRTAGLLPLLKSKGPYTFFAPTDDGWKRLPSEQREKLLADPARLKAALLYHILKARVDNVGLHKLRNALTMGGIVNIDYTSGVKVNGIPVSGADIVCRNGIMHAVEGFLLPSQRPSPKGLAKKGGKGKAGKPPAAEPTETEAPTTTAPAAAAAQ